MARRKGGTKKTKAQLLEEVSALQKRLAEFESQAAGTANATSNGTTPGVSVESFETAPLNQIAESVEQALRSVVPSEVDIRLCVEERLGLIQADPGVAEQLVVHLFLTRSGLQPQA